MIKIAIVDDEKGSIDSCKELIKSMNINELDIIDSFESGEIFLNEVFYKKIQ